MRAAVRVCKPQECGLFKERALLLVLNRCSKHFLRERRKNSATEEALYQAQILKPCGQG